MGSEDAEQTSFHVRAPHDSAPQAGVPKSPSSEGSPVLSDALESSTLGSVTSDESRMPSEFRRTLEAARTTAEKAAQLRQKERDVLAEPGRVRLEDVPFSSSHAYLERDLSSRSTSTLQSEELVSVSTPSTLSLSVTLSSDLSVTAAMSRTSQSGQGLLDAERVFPFTSQGRSRFSDVTDTASITAATSLLTKTSQSLGFSRPSSTSARQFSVLSSRTEPSTRISRALPPTVLSSGVATNFSGKKPSAFVTSSASIQSTTSAVSQASAFQPVTRSGYSPGYLDFYQQKMEEERQLFEAQRSRIRRYSDLYKKTTPEGPGAQTYQATGSVSKTVPPIEPLAKTSPYPWDQHVRVPTNFGRSIGDTNKENLGYMANSTVFKGQDRLRDISQRLGAFEKSLTTAASSTVVPSSSYTHKPLSTSDWSHGSSTEYMSLPRESAGPNARESAGSTFSSLSELTEMMTRLTSTSDESESTSSKARGVSGATEAHSFGAREEQTGYAPGKAANVGLGFSAGQSVFTSLEGNINLRGSSRERFYVPSSVINSGTNGPLDAVHSYVPTEKSIKSSGVMELPLNSQRSRWTRGSDGKQWFVLSRSRTLSSGVGILEKDSDAPGEGGADNVFADVNEDKSKFAFCVDKSLFKLFFLIALIGQR